MVQANELLGLLPLNVAELQVPVHHHVAAPIVDHAPHAPEPKRTHPQRVQDSGALAPTIGQLLAHHLVHPLATRGQLEVPGRPHLEEFKLGLFTTEGAHGIRDSKMRREHFFVEHEDYTFGAEQTMRSV